MIEHKNRVPGTANRKLITPEGGGAAFNAVVTFADNPTDAGSPITKAMLDEFLAASGTTTGTGDALLLAQAGFVLTDGAPIHAKAHVDINGACTINVNAQGAKSLLDVAQKAPTGIKAGSWITAIYSTSAGAFILQSVADAVAPKLIQTYAVAGTFTYTVPAGVTAIAVLVVGAGKGGTAGGSGTAGGVSAAGGTGGAGGYITSISRMEVTPGSTKSVVVGAGGANGANGGTSSFAGFTAAGGTTTSGAGGAGRASSSGSAGGAGTAGYNSGSGLISLLQSIDAITGVPYGAGGGGGGGGGSGSAPAGAGGGGGGGGVAGNGTGGAGGSGGAGGQYGANGTNGSNGANGTNGAGGGGGGGGGGGDGGAGGAGGAGGSGGAGLVLIYQVL